VSIKDRSRTQLQLLAAAKKVFGEQGYSGASTRAIASEAGVNLSLISRYFGGKHGLLLALIQHEASQLGSIVLDYPPRNSLVEECKAYATAYFNYLITNVDFVRLTITQALTDADFRNGFKNLNFSLVSKDITQRITEQLTNVANPPEQPDTAAAELIAGIERMALGTVTFQYLITEQPAEDCLNTIQTSLDALLINQS
jgi:AcrR family transcriptional regulator